MRNGEVIHPGADIELLSRWHDGELTPSERAHFEAHRAHCPACRRAADEYVDAMTFFRGSRGSGRPPRDLSARILRRIQPTGARRPPVGIVHGIDLRWAAAVILAIVAGVLGRAGVPQPEELAMPIRLVTPPAEIAPPPDSIALANPTKASQDADAEQPAPTLAAAVAPPERLPQARPVYPEPDTVSAARLPAPAPAPRRVRAPASPPPPIASSAPVRRSADRFGGEGAGGDAPALAEPPPSTEPLEVRITSADAGGWPPQVSNAEEIRLPAEQRGLRYIVMVDPQGIVRAVETIVPSASRGTRVLGVVPPAEIWKIRFHADGRPRRLLIKID
ncbi:MAG TPA: zf-HC2 domain-containing protein [Thermoanaerobaculia bacterium]